MTTPTARHAARPAAPWPGLLLLEQRRAASLTSTRVILFGCVVWSALSAAGYSWVAGAMVRDGVRITSTECFAFTVTKASFAPLASGVLALIWVAVDRRHGTLAAISLVAPSRLEVAATRWLFAACVGTTLTTATLAVNAAAAAAVGPAGCLAVPSSDIAVAVAAMTLATVGWVTLGLALGLLIGSPTLGTAVLLMGPLVVSRTSSVLSLQEGPLARLLEAQPFRAAERLQVPLDISAPQVIGAAAELSLPWAATSFLLGAGAVLVLATRRFIRSDLGAE